MDLQWTRKYIFSSFFYLWNSSSRGFMGADRGMGWGTWYIKKHGTRVPLLAEDEERNEKIELFRRHIEHAFGDVKSRFSMWQHKYRHDRKWCTLLWRYCCAIHNLLVNCETYPMHFHESWTKSVPHLRKPELFPKVQFYKILYCIILF